jgi:hypothetical protein
MYQQTLADGQLATAEASILTGAVACVGPLGNAGMPLQGNTVNLQLFNTSATLTETIEITFSRAGNSTHRGLGQIILAPKQKAVLNNIIIQANDTLYAYTTDATTVDYLISSSTNTGPITIDLFDSSGNKLAASGGNAATFTGRTTINLLNEGPAPVDTYAATMTIDVTKGFHKVAASNGTSAACTMTPSAAGTSGDNLTIITEADGSGTVTVTFAATFHSSGTQATTASTNSSIYFTSDGTKWIESGRVTAVA